MTDEPRLWEQARAGDGEAFAALFDRHRDRVFRQALRSIASRHDAEDVTALVFLEAWRLRDRVRLVDGSIVAWLLVTTNYGVLRIAPSAADTAGRVRRTIVDQMFTLTLPPLVADAATGRALAADVPDDKAAHVEIDASLVALADHGFVGELLDGLLERGLEVLVVGGASHDLRSSFARVAEHREFGEIWFQTDTAA